MTRSLILFISTITLVSSALSAPAEDDTPWIYLMGGELFSRRDLAAAEAAFAKAGVKEYRVEGKRIRVPRGMHNLCMAALTEHDALPKGYSGLLDSLHYALARCGGDQHCREECLRRAREEQLEVTIRSMRGIEDAQVAYRPATPQCMAWVSVRIEAPRPVSAEQISAIRQLVGKSIPGISAEQVAVIDLTTGRPYPVEKRKGNARASGGVSHGRSVPPGAGRDCWPSTSVEGRS